MSGIYISGMEMPTEGFVELLIRADGTVQQTGQSYRLDGKDYYTVWAGEVPPAYEAIPVPPHGRLIDADALKPYMLNKHYKYRLVYDTVEVANAPTIIPAEEGET